MQRVQHVCNLGPAAGPCCRVAEPDFELEEEVLSGRLHGSMVTHLVHLNLSTLLSKLSISSVIADISQHTQAPEVVLTCSMG